MRQRACITSPRARMQTCTYASSRCTSTVQPPIATEASASLDTPRHAWWRTPGNLNVCCFAGVCNARAHGGPRGHRAQCIRWSPVGECEQRFPRFDKRHRATNGVEHGTRAQRTRRTQTARNEAIRRPSPVLLPTGVPRAEGRAAARRSGALAVSTSTHSPASFPPHGLLQVQAKQYTVALHEFRRSTQTGLQGACLHLQAHKQRASRSGRGDAGATLLGALLSRAASPERMRSDRYWYAGVDAGRQNKQWAVARRLHTTPCTPHPRTPENAVLDALSVLRSRRGQCSVSFSHAREASQQGLPRSPAMRAMRLVPSVGVVGSRKWGSSLGPRAPFGACQLPAPAPAHGARGVPSMSPAPCVRTSVRLRHFRYAQCGDVDQGGADWRDWVGTEGQPWRA